MVDFGYISSVLPLQRILVAFRRKLRQGGMVPHNKVLKIKFSPDETYIVSFNGTIYAPDR